MQHVHARLAPGRAITTGDFADITTAPCVSVQPVPNGLLRATFDGALTTRQVWRVKVRIQSESTAEEDTLLQILTARDKANLTTATLADVKALAVLLANRELGDA